MQKRIYTTLMIVAMLAPASLALAEDGQLSPQPRPFERGEDRPIGMKIFPPLNATATRQLEKMHMMRPGSTTPKRLEVEKEIEMRKASSTARRIEIQQEVAKRKAGQTSQVLTATLNRLNEIASRMDSRIVKMRASGFDTTLAENYVIEAKNYLTQAKHDIDAFSSIQLTATSTQTNFQSIKDAAALVKSDFQDARESLKNALRALNPGEGEGPSASSTEER